MMELDLIQLRTVTTRLLDHIIETRGVKTTVLDHDYYWDIAPDSLYDTTQKPEKMDIGSLNDDWEMLSRLTVDENIPSANQLTELAPILRSLGEVLAPLLAGKGG